MKKAIVFALLLLPSLSFAHPGNTDSFGGHTCHTNCPEWGLYEGQYHFHNTSSGCLSDEYIEKQIDSKRQYYNQKISQLQSEAAEEARSVQGQYARRSSDSASAYVNNVTHSNDNLIRQYEFIRDNAIESLEAKRCTKEDLASQKEQDDRFTIYNKTRLCMLYAGPSTYDPKTDRCHCNDGYRQVGEKCVSVIKSTTTETTTQSVTELWKQLETLLLLIKQL